MFVCTACGRRFPLDEHHQRCPVCNEPLWLEIMRGKVGNGNVWERYRDFYTIPLNMNFSLGEGDTPLIKMEMYRNDVYLKNETVNPTWSFKDRGTFVAINRAIQMGFERIGVVSTGNMAASVAAYGAHAGLDTFVLVSSHISKDKIFQIMPYGAKILEVDGDYGELYFKSLEIGKRKGIYFMNSDDPFRVEGYKTIAYELAESAELDYVLVPTSSGGLFRGIYKGFLELKESGLIDKIPEMVAVQAEGCSPICSSYPQDKIERFGNPSTIAHAIENPYPPSGNAVLRIVKEHEWKCVKVEDEEIIKAQKELAHNGIFVQPASATTLAALKKLNLNNSRVALILTGSGLKMKSIEYNDEISSCSIDDLENCEVFK